MAMQTHPSVAKALKRGTYGAAHAAQAAVRCRYPRSIYDCSGNARRASGSSRWQLLLILELTYE